MIKIPMMLFILVLNTIGYAQNLAAFSDYQNRFFVFDNGNTRQLEFQPVISYQTGDKCIGYITNGNNFKIYYNHIDYDLESMVSKYIVTDNLVTYQLNSQLFVFEDGKKTLLSQYVGNYFAGDSLVAFFDTRSRFFQVYYKGQITTLEDGILYDNIRLFKAGNNILGYIDAYQKFKVFYQGQVTELLKTNLTVSGFVGRDIMAYIDPITDLLSVFYNNEVTVVESFKPKSYQVGYSKVAYVTSTGDFKIFDKGEIEIISNYEPDTFLLKDDILVYQQQGYLYAFISGENFLIENYIPPSYEIKGDMVAYRDMNGFLKLFKGGERIDLSFEKINDFKVNRGNVIFNEGMNSTKIYFNGKIYNQ
jgi:hypothetical protein